MKKKRILSLLLCLLIPGFVFAQTSRSKSTTAANQSWSQFWRQFSAAVNKKDGVAVKALMSSESDFFSGGGGENRDEWLRLMDQNNGWRYLQRSVALGTMPFKEPKGPSRITKDKNLIFRFIGTKWRFVGVMGD